MQKYVLAILSVFFSVNLCSAQFYDDEDEIYFYANEECDETFVFNFDGRKAACFEEHYCSRGVQQVLADDPYVYEKSVFTTDYDIKYNASKSKPNSIVYTRIRYWPITNDYTTTHFVFSRDRKTLDLYDGDKFFRTYKRVDKSYFMPGRQRKNLQDNTLYE